MRLTVGQTERGACHDAYQDNPLSAVPVPVSHCYWLRGVPLRVRTYVRNGGILLDNIRE
jgi:hypothetical protein